MKTNFGILDKIIIYPIFIFLLLSCNHSAKETKLIAEKRIQDSLALIREIEAKEAALEKARKDSIVLIEQEKVIGDINFGISKNEFYRLKSKFEKEHKKSYPADKQRCKRADGFIPPGKGWSG